MVPVSRRTRFAVAAHQARDSLEAYRVLYSHYPEWKLTSDVPVMLRGLYEANQNVWKDWLRLPGAARDRSGRREFAVLIRVQGSRGTSKVAVCGLSLW